METKPRAASASARPLAPLAATLIVAVAAHALLVSCGGGGQSSSNEPPAPTNTSAPPEPTPPGGGGAVAGDLELGAKVYKQRCVLCHGPEGKGDGPGAAALNPKPRNHTDGSYMNSRTDEELLEVIRNGKGQMPKWGGTLSDAEIQSVLVYVRTLAK